MLKITKTFYAFIDLVSFIGDPEEHQKVQTKQIKYITQICYIIQIVFSIVFVFLRRFNKKKKRDSFNVFEQKPFVAKPCLDIFIAQ